MAFFLLEATSGAPSSEAYTRKREVRKGPVTVPIQSPLRSSRNAALCQWSARKKRFSRLSDFGLLRHRRPFRWVKDLRSSTKTSSHAGKEATRQSRQAGWEEPPLGNDIGRPAHAERRCRHRICAEASPLTPPRRARIYHKTRADSPQKYPPAAGRDGCPGSCG